MIKTRVAVIRGGISDEYKESLNTGALVLEGIDTDRFQPLDIIISRSGEWLHHGRAYMPEYILHSVDVVFNALHGTYGEDGTIQRVFDRYAVPYTGSKAFASSVAMNKVLTKQFLRDANIKMAEHFHVTSESRSRIGRIAVQISDMFGPEYIVKPVSSGSSVGVVTVKNPTLLSQALDDALAVYDEVMVEKRVHGREASCGVVERYRDTQLYALPPIEIIPPQETDFFDHAVKYNGTTQEICPARFDHETKTEIERIAKTVHRELGLAQYSRSDFMVAHDGVYFLEVNTLPGMTKESLFPKAIEAVGGTYGDFITHLLDDALATRAR